MEAKPVRIIQSSYPHTGSTLLINMIHGFLSPDEEIHWHTEKIDDESGREFVHLYTITKSHEINFDKLIKTYGGQYDLYFIVTERDKRYESQYYNRRKNILIFKYDDIVETPEKSIEQIMRMVYQRMKDFLPCSVFPSQLTDETIIRNGINRIKSMNVLCDQIHDQPFSYYDKFFGIHGHHRNRKQ